MKKILYILCSIAVLVLFFMHPAAVAIGCSAGLNLWYTAVLPSLLPWLIVSGLLVGTRLFRYLNRFYAPPLSCLLGISQEGCYAVLMGFLCGFPMGAKVTADLVREGHISADEGNYLLSFCNNVSPAFFLNYICLAKLNYQTVPWSLVAVFYAVPLLYGIFTRPLCHFQRKNGYTTKQAPLQRIHFPMLDACIMDSFATVTRLGGYIILFSILARLSALLPLGASASVLIGALLEISGGIDGIVSAASCLSPVLRTSLVCACAAFGGFSTCAQTQSVIAETPLRLRSYLTGRLAITLLTHPAVLLLQSAAPALRGCW
ncbi:MAG: transporter [Lachnospiraceae bacterium]|nr:transporter [Lachnospiraceae bacterium]